MRIRVVKHSESDPMCYKPIGDDTSVNEALDLDSILALADAKLSEYSNAPFTSWGASNGKQQPFYIKHGKDHATPYGVVVCR